MSGWVQISRTILKHEIFAGDMFSRRDAWVWLIANAAWKDTKHRVGGTVYKVPRGTLFCTLRQLANEWGWKSDYKVRSFLELLESDNMITRKATQGKTHITICNYSLYQDKPQPDNEEKTQRKRKENALKEQNNNTTLLGRERELYDALGVNDENTSPGLLVLSEPLWWVDAGS